MSGGGHEGVAVAIMQVGRRAEDNTNIEWVCGLGL